MASDRARQLLKPYLESDAVRPNGDMDMYCPIHEDARRSATINFRTNEWYCHACESGGSIRSLLALKDEWLPPHGRTASDPPGNSIPLPDTARLDGWTSALLTSAEKIEFLELKRGINQETISRYSIGWNKDRYTIPIYDERGKLSNIRIYSPVLEPKIKNWQGYGSPPRLFPIEALIEDPGEVVICEGEWDALICNQNGLPAVTSTGGVKTLRRWRENWTDWFADRVVYVCFDRDTDGLKAQREVAEKLGDIARKIISIELPFALGSGKDLTDYFLNGGTAGDLRGLVSHDRRVKQPRREAETADHVEYESLRSGGMEGKLVEVQGTLSSVFGTQVMLPKSILGTCNISWDEKRCALCPLSQVDGKLVKKISDASDINLELLGANSLNQREQLFRKALGAPQKCPVVEVEPDYYGAWDCEIRNGSNLAEEAYPVVLRHEGKPPQLNRTYKFIGRLKVSPKGQRAVFMSSGCTPAMQDLDTFEPQDEDIERARDWVTSLSGEPEDKIEQIAETLEYHCTEIYGQRLLHIAMDMVYHSVLNFKFGGSVISRGWMECLAVGETRSGKTTALQRMRDLYGRGHYQSAENTSIPGMLYGIERRGGQRSDAWGGTIGVLPLNNRGLVAIDEAQGLSKDQIGQLSDMRSRGVVQISKIRAVEVDAKVRLVWLANGRRDSYSHGIDALRDQMGQAEDLARIDLPIYIQGDIGDELNKAQKRWGKMPWSPEILQWIILWVWSRKPDDIRWTAAATKAIWKYSKDLSAKFSVSIPIFQPNEAGVRLARLAVAVAARLFNSPDGHRLLVQSAHVKTAANLYERFLGAHDLGLTDLHSQEDTVSMAEDDFSVELRSYLKSVPLHIRQQLVNGWIDPMIFPRLDPGGTYLMKLSGWHAIYLESGQYKVAQWAVNIAKEIP